MGHLAKNFQSNLTCAHTHTCTHITLSKYRRKGEKKSYTTLTKKGYCQTHTRSLFVKKKRKKQLRSKSSRWESQLFGNLFNRWGGHYISQCVQHCNNVLKTLKYTEVMEKKKIKGKGAKLPSSNSLLSHWTSHNGRNAEEAMFTLHSGLTSTQQCRQQCLSFW